MNKRLSNSAESSERSGKRVILGFLVLAFIAMAAAMPESDPFIVVLDAGHGGSDPGNLGTGRYKKTEKDVSLDVTLLVGKYIEQNYPEVKIVYTRKGDSFPTLNQRVETANNAMADLFISIHCNANDNKGAYGAETFVMGLHKSEESLKTAMRENASIYLEKDHEKNYGGFDPKNPDTYIILSMRENAFLERSINLAKSVQDQFRTRVGRKDRGVKQAGYYVISFTNMPSILVELGFLTNAEEEDYLHSEDGKTYLASAIYRAFREFREKDLHGKSKGHNGTVKEETTAKGGGEQVVAETSNNPVPAPSDAVVWKDITKGIRYQVQILSSPKPLDKNDPQFRGLKRTEEYKQNGVFKYLAGSTASYKEARQMQEQLRGMGFKDAFVIAFENGVRIELSKAIAQTTD